MKIIYLNEKIDIKTIKTELSVFLKENGFTGYKRKDKKIFCFKRKSNEVLEIVCNNFNMFEFSNYEKHYVAIFNSYKDIKSFVEK